MSAQLTKDADRMICHIYKEFLHRRKEGFPKSTARRFDENYFRSHKPFSSYLPGDVSDTFLEIGRAGLVHIYLGGSFELTDCGIIYMENRFSDNLKEITDFITKFFP